MSNRIVSKVLHEHVSNFGYPDESFVFENDPADGTLPPKIDVLFWNANQACDMTSMSTIGMSAKRMPGAKHRAELHFAIRKKLAKKEMAKISKFMANLAMAPFIHNFFFDWHHSVSKPQTIPLFVDAKYIWLHPPFVENGWGEIQSGATEIRLLNIIPITKSELALKTLEERYKALEPIDIFTPR